MKSIRITYKKIFFLIVLAVLFFLIINDLYAKQLLKKSKNEIVVKFTEKTILPKTTKFKFIYFFKGVKKETEKSGIHYSILNSVQETNEINNLKINCFYIAKITEKYPDMILVCPERKITDTLAILEAGFSKEDIKHEK
jgi:hypothetical protein